MHFHRDLLIIADGYAREVLGVTPDDVFVGSPPLAFTFGLGGLAIFPLRFGATATLLETASPQNMIEIIQTHRATICFTAPTAYRVMLQAMDEGADLSCLRCAVSAGETLPGPVYEEWLAKTGKPMLDGIGATEMLHIFITNRFGDSFPATTGRPVTGYRAKVVDEDMNEVPRGTPGRLAVQGPTGCRYLADQRQRNYVRDGWNITGDTFVEDENGLLPLRRPQRRHDPLRRLQHRRPRGGGRTHRPRRRPRMRRRRRRRRRPRPDRPGPRRPRRGRRRPTPPPPSACRTT